MADKLSQYSLGPLPWTRERLINAYWADWLGSLQKIKEHPGYLAHQALDDIQASLEMFFDCVDDLTAATSYFRDQAAEHDLFSRGNRQRLEQLERSIRKSFFAVTSTAFALVDTTRRVRKHYEVIGYDEQVKESFSENELHRFIQDLRNVFSHRHLLNPGWQIIYKPGGKITRFILSKEDLNRYVEWCPLARRFMEKHSFEIDVENLTSEYRLLVEHFHKWFRDAILAFVGNEIKEYTSYERILKGEQWRQYWRLYLNEGIKRNLDPYNYLDRFLSPEEVERAKALPRHSREQADLMISMADEYNICDNEIRGLVYRLFGIS